MTTTIQVRDITRQRLETLKARYNAASYDEVITKITEQELDIKDNQVKKMFGSLKGIGPWTKADRARSKYE